MHAAEAAAAAKTGLTSALSGVAAAIITQTRSNARITMSRRLVKSAGRGCVIVRGTSVGLSVHAVLAAVRAEAALAIARVVLVVVGVAVVWVVVTGILLAVRLGLRTRTSLLLLRLLRLAGRIGGVVAAVLSISSTRSKARLVVHAALRVLAEAVGLLRGIVATETALLRAGVVRLALCTLLLSELLAIVVVRVAVVLARGIV